jgi:hypothetical protein
MYRMRTVLAVMTDLIRIACVPPIAALVEWIDGRLRALNYALLPVGHDLLPPDSPIRERVYYGPVCMECNCSEVVCDIPGDLVVTTCPCMTIVESRYDL